MQQNHSTVDARGRKGGSRPFLVLLAVLLLAGGLGARSVGASSVAGGDTSGDASGGATGGLPASFITLDVHGGYVAAGVGLRNRGFGTISLSGIPAGATITRAYLFWAVLNNSETAALSHGKFKGTNIVGTKAGHGGTPCWGTTAGYSYRANVTSLVKGNGSYALSGFASGLKNGAQPALKQALPFAEGASLVVVYSKASYPLKRIKFDNGYGLTKGATLTTVIPFGFAASNPVGEVKTTFIGADGQNNLSEPGSKFNNVALPTVDWDGTDAPIPRYTTGNLWDTDTVSVGRWVGAGSSSASMTVTGGPDCLVWVAQVLSIEFNGAADSDGDNLLNGWESNGYDANGDHVVDVNLPGFGASPVHKDLFVEMDYMGTDHLPATADLNRIVSAYALAPFANNPDGLRGIKLHLDAGAARGAGFNLGGGESVPVDTDLNPVQTQFDSYRSTYFNPKRDKIFYYMIWAYRYDGGNSSGNAMAIPNDQFVVTLGSFGGTPDQQVGTFMHEFGHDLGLFHGGNENKNYKPNHLSVMNYRFQFGGIPLAAGGSQFSYSRADLPDLDENALDESVGLNSASAAPYETAWYCPNFSIATSPGTANGPLDWDCNNVISGTVAVDVNGDNVNNVLTGFNEWANIVYGGGRVGSGATLGREVPQVPSPEYDGH